MCVTGKYVTTYVKEIHRIFFTRDCGKSAFTISLYATTAIQL